jgi:hypothetical protein
MPGEPQPVPAEAISSNSAKTEFQRLSSEFYRRFEKYNPELRTLSADQDTRLETQFGSQLEQQLSAGDKTPDYKRMTERLGKVQELKRKLQFLPSGYLDSADNRPKYQRAVRIIDDSFQRADGKFDTAAFGAWVFVEAYSKIGKSKSSDFSDTDTLEGICYLMDRIHPELVQSGYLDRMKSFHQALQQDSELTGFARSLGYEATTLSDLESRNREYPPRSLGSAESYRVGNFAAAYNNERQVELFHLRQEELQPFQAIVEEITRFFGVASTITESDTPQTAQAKVLEMKSLAVQEATKVVEFDRFDTQTGQELPIEMSYEHALSTIQSVIREYDDKLPKYDGLRVGVRLSGLGRIQKGKKRKII